MRGLYIGTSATVTQAAFLTSAQLGSYDVIKNDVLVRKFLFDSVAGGMHLCASMIASLLTNTVLSLVLTKKVRQAIGMVSY